MNVDINDKYKILIIPQSGFSIDGDCLLTVKNRGKFYAELADKFKESTILYTIGSTKSHDNTFNMKGYNLVCLKDHRNRKAFGLVFNYLKTIIRIIKLIRCHDVLVVFIPNKSATLAALVGRICNKIIITYVAIDWRKIALIPYENKKHNIIISYIKYFLNTIFEYIAVSSATFVFVAGRSLLKKLKKYNKSIEETIPMIEFGKSDIFIRNDTFQSKTINILYVGSLTKRKAVQYLIEAFDRINNHYSNCILHIVGDGELYNDLQKNSCENIIFHGHLNRKIELSNLYKLADIFICPSLSEGFPRVLYEAMIHSVPIITTDVDGIKFFFKDKIDALLIPPENAEQIFNKFCLIANDKFLRQKLILNSQKKINHIFRSRTSEQFYQKIIECTANRIKN